MGYQDLQGLSRTLVHPGHKDMRVLVYQDIQGLSRTSGHQGMSACILGHLGTVRTSLIQGHESPCVPRHSGTVLDPGTSQTQEHECLYTRTFRDCLGPWDIPDTRT